MGIKQYRDLKPIWQKSQTHKYDKFSIYKIMFHR